MANSLADADSPSRFPFAENFPPSNPFISATDEKNEASRDKKKHFGFSRFGEFPCAVSLLPEWVLHFGIFAGQNFVEISKNYKPYKSLPLWSGDGPLIALGIAVIAAILVGSPNDLMCLLLAMRSQQKSKIMAAGV